MADPYPVDYDELKEFWPYAFESDFRYVPRYAYYGRVAHIVAHDTSGYGGYNAYGLCGVNAEYGSGSWEEVEQAHWLPLCRKCIAKSGDLDIRKVPPE